MWWILMALEDMDTVCNEVTLTTNLGHVCEIEIKKVPILDCFIRTPRGYFYQRECPRFTTKLLEGDFCEEKNFKVIYEKVTVKESPIPLLIPTKFGIWRPLGDTVWICRHGTFMKEQGSCEWSYERRKKR